MSASRTCECGCGTPTKVATRTDARKGWVKGEPFRFAYGHGGRAAAARTEGVRFRANVDINPESGCWLWTGATDAGGYGRFAVRGTSARAHRWSYEKFRGPIPDGLHIDHLCRVRNCVNPDHLEPVEPAENTRRGLGGRLSHLVTECRKGHSMTPENTIRNRSNGRRQCRTCHNAAVRRRRALIKGRVA